ENFLHRKVGDLLSATSDPTLVQYLDINVPSADNVYVGRVDRKSPLPFGPGPPRTTPPVIPGHAAAAAVTNLLDHGVTPPSPTGGADALQLRDLVPGRAIDHFESECGIVVTGGILSPRIVTTKGERDAAVEWV